MDLALASGGRFDHDPQAIYDRWQEFLDWGRQAGLSDGEAVAAEDLGPPVPRPRQVFAAALNYRAPGSAGAAPDVPVVFTKYPACLVGPVADVELPSALVDYEVELVVVIGRPAVAVAERDAWDHVAGVTVGQDLIDRELVSRDPTGQLCLPKSFPGFGPTGPWVLTADEPAAARRARARGDPQR